MAQTTLPPLVYILNPTFAWMVTFPDLLNEELPVCPACGNPLWQKGIQAKDYSVSGEWFELKTCSSCGLKMTWPQPEAENIGRYYASSEYISHSDTKTGLINKLYHSAREYMLKKKFQWVVDGAGRSNGHLLDVGAGTGHFAHYMQQQGWDVLALEPDETARKVGAEKLNLKILPLEDLASQQPDNFDVITLWHVLEHVHDLPGYIDHFHSILKKDGTLMIAVPNYSSKDAKHYSSQWAAYDVPRHLWHFSPEAMKQLLSRHGFQIVQKMDMPLDAFYVSMLSEKYKGNYFFGPVSAFFNGFQSYWKGRKNKDQASSIIYISKKF
jgi:2-polyprenyl-3-methyl-5-hydroxy-6-metoxy-1,4-benzoquinol methylase